MIAPVGVYAKRTRVLSFTLIDPMSTNALLPQVEQQHLQPTTSPSRRTWKRSSAMSSSRATTSGMQMASERPAASASKHARTACFTSTVTWVRVKGRSEVGEGEGERMGMGKSVMSALTEATPGIARLVGQVRVRVPVRVPVWVRVEG
jgi:hypothetical protein